MSQNELASNLQVNQSFLSAIENGKSPLPVEKETRLLEIFGLKDFSGFIIRDNVSVSGANLSATQELSESDLFNQLLSRFHEHAHRREGDSEHHEHHQRIHLLEERVDRLLERIDELMDNNNELMCRNNELMKINNMLQEQSIKLREEMDTMRKI